MSVIKNELNEPVDVFVIIDDDFEYKKKKAFKKNGVRESKINAATPSAPIQEMPYEPFEPGEILTESFMIRFELSKNPKKNGFEGVKIALAGTKFVGPYSGTNGLTVPHHFSYYKKGNKYYAEVHYMIEELQKIFEKINSKSKDFNDWVKDVIQSDLDPTVKHPGGG